MDQFNAFLRSIKDSNANAAAAIAALSAITNAGLWKYQESGVTEPPYTGECDYDTFIQGSVSYGPP
ncbi:hypothetical protein RSAG8_13983, partial [Rhizoctonia solani AG-8 WAC10335]